MDTICSVCLSDLNGLAKVEQEVAKAFPATATMTRPQIWARVWKHHEEQRKLIEKLKRKLQESRSDLKEAIGDD